MIVIVYGFSYEGVTNHALYTSMEECRKAMEKQFQNDFKGGALAHHFEMVWEQDTFLRVKTIHKDGTEYLGTSYQLRSFILHCDPCFAGHFQPFAG